jgi:hypothetical protein
MKSIRYNLHFPALIVAALIFWSARNVHFLERTFNFDFFHYGLMGILHATCVVISLRDRRATHTIIGFTCYALCFVALAGALSAATPILGLWGSLLWTPITTFLPPDPRNGIIIFLTGSAIGASGYWLLVRQFWLKSLRRTDWLKTIALCVAATWLSSFASEALHPKMGVEVFDFIITAGWWFAFSISLYWGEMSGNVSKSIASAESAT